MRKIERLRLEALKACRFRGHKMRRFRTSRWYPTMRYTTCTVCGMEVTIDSHPAPNGIEIGGEAVALDCGDPSRFDSDGSLK